MTTIYDLNEEMQRAVDEMFFLSDDNADDIAQAEKLQAVYDAAQGTIEHKLNYLLGILQETKAVAELRKEVSKRAAIRAKSAENQAERLRAFIRDAMHSAGIKKIENDYCTASIQKGREAAFIDENIDLSKLPEKYTTYKPESWTPDKRNILKALKSGELEIDGIELVRGDDVMVVRG